jgi:hypothetical protein
LRSSGIIPAKPPLPQNAVRNHSKHATERRRPERKAKRKREEIAKSERNNHCAKLRQLKEIVVSSDEDPSPSLLCTGDKESANVDCSG